MKGDIQTDTVQGYAYLASYLVNNDKSSLKDVEVAEAKEFVSDIKEHYGDDSRIVSTKGNEYFGYPEFGGVAGTLTDYVIHYREE